MPVPAKVPVTGSYNSALVRTRPVLPEPPATITLPLFSNVAVCEMRAVFRLPVRVKVPVVGSYNSALANVGPRPLPPAISTVPLFSNVAVNSLRAVLMLPVRLKVAVAGSYNSALSEIEQQDMVEIPAATSTVPLFSNVAVWPARGVFRLPVGVKVPVTGSYNSALVRTLLALMAVGPMPPATSTIPLFSNVAVWVSRAWFRLPVGVKVPVTGSYNSALAR